jgi:hypothetical protein
MEPSTDVSEIQGLGVDLRLCSEQPSGVIDSASIRTSLIDCQYPTALYPSRTGFPRKLRYL